MIHSQDQTIAEAAVPWDEKKSGHPDLMKKIGAAPLVLIGEATHGTREFYRERAAITRELIEKKEFKAVAVEADWPDAYRINRYVRGLGRDSNAGEALEDFKRFPRWMWRNREVSEFIEWLRDYNSRFSSPEEKVGFYGLVLYSLYGSIDAVLTYLDKVDPEAAQRARFRYSCFDHFGEDPQSYGYASEFGLAKPCEEAALKQLQELNERAYLYVKQDGFSAQDEWFYAEQNASLVHDAEKYYRSLFQPGASSWNLRDRHMGKTLEALRKHLQKNNQPAHIAVWAHNSHVGDASATEMSERGELNVGQIIRSRYGAGAYLIGFTTFTGTVAAASDWGRRVEKKRVLPALPGSYEDFFHQAGPKNFLLLLDGLPVQKALEEPRLERAIGVIYRPDSERLSHYFQARLARQFDAVIHFHQTQAVTPLDAGPEWDKDIVPETYPSGL